MPPRPATASMRQPAISAPGSRSGIGALIVTQRRVASCGMQTTTLGPFTVSRLCLGTMLMGAKTPVDESHRMLDRFLEAGGNFLDTADTYSDGGSEETLAPWLARRRDEVVLATKLPLPGLRPRRRGARARAGRAGVRREPAPARRRRDRPLPGPRARSGRAARGRRSRRSTRSCAPARCARSACRTSRPGCSPGRSRCRTARAGRRSSRCSRSTRSSSARSRSSCCRSAAPPASA